MNPTSSAASSSSSTSSSATARYQGTPQGNFHAKIVAPWKQPPPPTFAPNAASNGAKADTITEKVSATQPPMPMPMATAHRSSIVPVPAASAPTQTTSPPTHSNALHLASNPPVSREAPKTITTLHDKLKKLIMVLMEIIPDDRMGDVMQTMQDIWPRPPTVAAKAEEEEEERKRRAAEEVEAEAKERERERVTIEAKKKEEEERQRIAIEEENRKQAIAKEEERKRLANEQKAAQLREVVRKAQEELEILSTTTTTTATTSATTTTTAAPAQPETVVDRANTFYCYMCDRRLPKDRFPENKRNNKLCFYHEPMRAEAERAEREREAKREAKRGKYGA